MPLLSAIKSAVSWRKPGKMAEHRFGELVEECGRRDTPKLRPEPIAAGLFGFAPERP